MEYWVETPDKSVQLSSWPPVLRYHTVVEMFWQISQMGLRRHRPSDSECPGFYGIKHQWSDTARLSLEDKLGEIVMAIQSMPDLISEERHARHPRELQEVRESLARRRRRNDRIRLAHERVEAIEKLASELDRALQVRALVGVINNWQCGGFLDD
jgi:hypothetical protein